MKTRRAADTGFDAPPKAYTSETSCWTRTRVSPRQLGKCGTKYGAGVPKRYHEPPDARVDASGYEEGKGHAWAGHPRTSHPATTGNARGCRQTVKGFPSFPAKERRRSSTLRSAPGCSIHQSRDKGHEPNRRCHARVGRWSMTSELSAKADVVCVSYGRTLGASSKE